MSLTALLLIFCVALLFVLLGIIKFNLHPFLALLLGALLMGIGSGMPLTSVSSAIAKGFGGTMEGIGIVIILGVIFGELLHRSGSTEQIAAMMLRATGEKRSATAMALTGYIVSIPVFFDAAFVILVNLAKSLSRRGKIPFISLVTALAVGLITTHAMIVPTPGPLVVADTMKVNLGWFLLYSILVTLPAVMVGGVVYGRFLGGQSGNEGCYEEVEVEVENVSTKQAAHPSGMLGVGLIFLPIAIILLGTVIPLIIDKNSALGIFFRFIGDKNIALLIGILVAFIALRPYLRFTFNEIISEATKQAGIILAITGAGGAFGKIINETGIGKLLLENLTGLTGGSGIAIIIAAWLISQILRAAQGSTTVALVTTSAMFAPLMAGLPTLSPVLVGLAICAGGIGCSLPNDSGFWVVNRFAHFDMKQTIQSWSVAGAISGVTALIGVIVLSFFSGILPGLLP